MARRTIRKTAYVFPWGKGPGKPLAHSLMDVFRQKGVQVDEYDLIAPGGKEIDTNVLDGLIKNKKEYDLVFVVDLGWIHDHRIHKDNFDCPVIAIAGDSLQNFYPKNGWFRKVYHALVRQVKTAVKHRYQYGHVICSRQYDLVLTNNYKATTEWLRRMGVDAEWFPYWIDSRLYIKGLAEKPDLEVVTCMSTKNRRKVLQFLSRSRRFSFTNGLGNYDENYVRFLRRGRIGFNNSNYGEMNSRYLEMMGAGLLLFSDPIPAESGLKDLFTEGKHFVFYRSLMDLEKKAFYYLSHETERRAMAQAAQDEVFLKHTERNRAEWLLEKAAAYQKEKKVKRVSIHILSWNRPLLLKMTLLSLMTSLRNSKISYEVILLDQNSNEETKQIIRDHAHFIDKIIWKEKNIGMSAAWVEMFERSNADYILPVENDWWCSSRSSKWLEDAVAALDKEKNMAFMKLRRLYDRQYGLGSVEHEPWSVRPFPADKVSTGKLENGSKYFIAGPRYNCFTFNPVLMRKEFRREFSCHYADDPGNKTPLRSGEDRPTSEWRKQDKWVSGALWGGPFRHIGFPSVKEHLLYSPFFILRYLFRKIWPGMIKPEKVRRVK